MTLLIIIGLLATAHFPVAARAQSGKSTLSLKVIRSPLPVELILPPGGVPIGKWIDARVIVRNRTRARLTFGSAKLKAKSAVAISPEDGRKFGGLASGKSWSGKWRLKFGKAGPYRVRAEARAVQSGKRTHVNGVSRYVLANGRFNLWRFLERFGFGL